MDVDYPDQNIFFDNPAISYPNSLKPISPNSKEAKETRDRLLNSLYKGRRIITKYLDDNRKNKKYI